MFSLESPRRGDSNEYTQYTIFNIKKKITLIYPKSAAMGFCSKGLKNEFETVVVNELLVFEPLKFYCIGLSKHCKSRPDYSLQEQFDQSLYCLPYQRNLLLIRTVEVVDLSVRVFF